ncbi:hypothetical protein ACKFKF_18895 [Phormidesmis sp. 146-12]
MTQTTDPVKQEPSLDQLAETVGLSLAKHDPAYIASKPVASKDEEEIEAERDEDDDDDDEALDPEQNRAKSGFHNNGLAKAAVVGGGSLMIVLGVMTFYKGAIPQQKAAKPVDPDQTQPKKDPAAEEIEKVRLSESQSKAELALQKQRDVFSSVDKKNGKTTLNEKDVKPKTQPIAPSAPRSEVATPVSQPAPIASAPAMITPPLSAPVVRPILTPANAIASQPDRPEIDPNLEWQRLSVLGRFGTVSPGFGTAAIAANLSINTAKSGVPPNSSLTDPGKASASKPAVVSTPVSSAPPLSQYFRGTNVRSLYKQAGLNTLTAPSSPIRALLVGTSAKAATLTPILWAPNSSTAARFLIKLDEPMLDGNNSVAFPIGTQFIVTTNKTDPNTGIVDLEVISVIINGAEFSPPAGAIVIRDDKGGLLVGEDYYKRQRRVAGKDMMLIFASALGNIGSILNRSQSSSSTSISTGGVSSTTTANTNPPPNYLGAALEGGFSKLSEVLSSRNEKAIQTIMSAPKVFQIPQGRSMQVFVNQSISF